MGLLTHTRMKLVELIIACTAVALVVSLLLYRSRASRASASVVAAMGVSSVAHVPTTAGPPLGGNSGVATENARRVKSTFGLFRFITAHNQPCWSWNFGRSPTVNNRFGLPWFDRDISSTYVHRVTNVQSPAFSFDQQILSRVYAVAPIYSYLHGNVPFKRDIPRKLTNCIDLNNMFGGATAFSAKRQSSVWFAKQAFFAAARHSGAPTGGSNMSMQ